MPETIRYTVLPGGLNAGRAMFSVILTPNVTAGEDIPALFRDWPDKSSVHDTGNWTLQIKRGTTVVSQGLGKPVSDPPRSDLWKALMDKSLGGKGKIPVRPRTGAEAFRRAWLHSHDAHLLHKRHDDHRFYHVFGQLMDVNNLGEQNTRDIVDAQIKETAPRNVYVFPEVGSGTDAMAKAIASRDAATAFLQGRLASAPVNVRTRIAQGRKQLEDEQGERPTTPAPSIVVDIWSASLSRAGQ